MSNIFPRISIVTVCYNVVDEIENTILSVLSQTYPNIEYIIIDGGSNDGTVRVIKEYQNRIYHWVSEPDKGIYDAMNKGIGISTGKWINFMNAGDTFYNEEVVSEIVKRAPANVDVVFGDVYVEYGHNCYIEKAQPFYNNLPLHHDMGFNHQSCFISVPLAKKYPFEINYILAADYNMVITLYRNGATFKYLELVVARYKLGGLSDKKRRLHIFETLMVDNPQRRKFNLILSYILFAKKKLFSIIKKYLFLLFPHLGVYLMEKVIRK